MFLPWYTFSNVRRPVDPYKIRSLVSALDRIVAPILKVVDRDLTNCRRGVPTVPEGSYALNDERGVGQDPPARERIERVEARNLELKRKKQAKEQQKSFDAKKRWASLKK